MGQEWRNAKVKLGFSAAAIRQKKKSRKMSNPVTATPLQTPCDEGDLSRKGDGNQAPGSMSTRSTFAPVTSA